MSADKDTIYIDVDDEITNIIDKATSSKHKIVALVLPKRATVLQSAVNMKLLKRSADKAKKNLVLITSEAGLLPLAGSIGLHVAKNLQTKPVIPSGPDQEAIPDALINEDELEEPLTDPQLDASQSVGKLSGQPESSLPEPEEQIELDDVSPEVAAASTAGAIGAAKAAKKAKKANMGKDRKLKVPNFERFRKWLIFGGIALVILLIGGYFAFFALPKAKIVISTDTSNVNANLSFTADTTTKDFDEANSIIPAQTATTSKTDNQSIAATGQQNNGDKATGSVTMTASGCTTNQTPSKVPAGTGLSSGGLTYITQEDAQFSFDHIAGGCIYYRSSGTDITAQNGGSNYNTSGSTNFTVAGRSDVSASGKASGGTDKNVTVVSQADIDGAKSKFTAPDSKAIQQQLTDQLAKEGLMAIASSFHVDGPTITASNKAGDQVSNFTATSTTNYSLLGISQKDLKTYVDNQIKKQINSSQQAILDDGLSQASYSVGSGASPTISVQITATIGPNLDVDAIKRDIVGKKKAETISAVESRSSIKGVTVNYSPFWVTKTPTNPNKIIISFKKAND